MKDLRGREIDYMRISITDRCNLRCRYCMPEGIESHPRWEILSLEEIEAAAACAAGLGIRHIKITGGEPLVRKDCCSLIKRVKEVKGIEKVTITTNGLLLRKYLPDLLEAGIDGINISLDTLNRQRYLALTGFDGLHEVMEAIKEVSALPIPVKINAVSLELGGDQEEQDWRKLTGLAKEFPVDVRFIEMMPIGYGKQFKTINHKELLEAMKKVFPDMEEDKRQHGFGPAVYYKIPGFSGSIGFISAIHGKFCDSCNRIRLTSEGYLKPCLCYEEGVDLRRVLRDGAQFQGETGHYIWPYRDNPCEEGLQKRLRAVMKAAIEAKPAAHCFEKPEQITESHGMSSIGG